MKNPVSNAKIAFWGTPDFAVLVLAALEKRGILPDLVVCAPDAPKGRKLVVTPPPTKVWAIERGIPFIQPTEIKSAEFAQTLASLCPDKGPSANNPSGDRRWDLFIVAAYGKIIPEHILYAPVRKTINVHPSMLPLLRGSSPLQSAILADMRDTGTTIMLLDKEMDHGPLLAQKQATFTEWPVDTETLGRILAQDGGDLIADILPYILDGSAHATEQDHSKATYTKKITKEDGLINLAEDGYDNWLKFNVYKGWPGSFFFIDKDGKQIRVSITDAAYADGVFSPLKAVPEGKSEMAWDEFERGYSNR
ncbi:MAG: methionyl-tRNA formyltransferase [bacterium]|nr:methionyl-tRNA formyltransferase [bacterium]